jgi:hypothetical protein
VGKRNHARREGIVAGDADEKIHELHRRRRGRKIPARNPPRDDDGGFFRVCENYLAHDEPMTLEPVSILEAALELPAAF